MSGKEDSPLLAVQARQLAEYIQENNRLLQRVKELEGALDDVGAFLDRCGAVSDYEIVKRIRSLTTPHKDSGEQPG